MKVSVDDQELFTLTEIQKQVIQNEIPAEHFDEDMKRRLKWILTHKYEQCMSELWTEWAKKLQAKGITDLPSNPDDFARLVFSQPEYKNRSQRDQDLFKSRNRS